MDRTEEDYIRENEISAAEVEPVAGFDYERSDPQRPHLWLCGCLINDAGAHRVGCPDFPEGRR